jgi:phosphonate transport system substrate-binding protein
LPLTSNLVRFFLIAIAAVFVGLLAVACAQEETPTLRVGGIPDQDAQRLARRYEIFANYLSKELDVSVEYVPSVSYSAVVTAFSQNDVQLAFFGGLTGVQARLQNPGAQAIAQRENDAQFHSKFIVRADDGFADLDGLDDLVGRTGDMTITFGSESSTSGHLMPRHFLSEAGINAATDFRSKPSFSGSHDKTWQLVEAGSFDMGALNEDVWNRAVSEGRADTTKVREFYTTPDYFDYNWTVRPDLDDVYGDGFANRVQEVLLALNPQDHGEILELFSTERFIATENDNYQAIEKVARELSIIQ